VLSVGGTLADGTMARCNSWNAVQRSRPLVWLYRPAWWFWVRLSADVSWQLTLPTVIIGAAELQGVYSY
jgi:hypothetical protein